MTDEEDLAPVEERKARGIQLFREGFRQTSRKYRGVSRRTVHLELDDATFNSFREEAKRAAENNVQCSSFAFEVACCPSKDKLKGRTCRKLRFRNDEEEP
jgi:hypothetical protein